MRAYRRGRPEGRWSAAEMAAVVEAVLRAGPDRLWSADDLRARLAFGHEGGGPAASSVRSALRVLEERGSVERVEVWGRRGWGGTAHAYRARRGPQQARLPIAA